MQAYSLSCAVGASSRNQAQDVTRVQSCFIHQFSSNPSLKQKLLQKANQLGETLPAEGTELETYLSIPANDTLALGILTSLIKCWQAEVMRFARPDGKIEPNGPTWRSLNGNVANVQSIQPQVAVQSVNSTAASGVMAGSYALFKQGDYAEHLFNSSQTVAAKGCYLCTLVMAATAIGSRTAIWGQAGVNVNPNQLNPHLGNLIARRDASAHSGASINAVRFAKDLGMSFKPHADGNPCAYPHHPNTQPLNAERDVRKISEHIASGRPVAAGVNYSCNNLQVQHWILIVEKTGDGFIALDPGIGKKVLLSTQSLKSGFLRRLSQNNAGVILFGVNTNPSVNPQIYGVVSYALLASL